MKIEVKKLWNVKARVILVLISVLGTVSNNLEKHLDEIGVPKDITSLQKMALLGTAFILRKVLGISEVG